MYGRQRYKKDSVSTAQPGELVVMLYDGILRFIGEAAAALELGDAPAVGRAVRRTIDIIAYLQASLRSDVAPELVELLDRTYSTWSAALVRANAKRDVEKMRAVREQVAELRGAWAEANVTVKTKPSAQIQSAA